MTNHSTASKWNVLTALVFGILLIGSSSASAALITFDFEALATQQTPSISSTVSGLTVTVSRKDGTNIAVQNLNSPTAQVPAFGTRNLSNFAGGFNATVDQSTLVFNFSSPISSASISFGDLGGDFTHDDDSPVVLTAFSGLNGSGANLGSNSVSYPDNLGFLDQGNGAIRSVSFGGASFQSFTISSAGNAPGTLYYDNLIVDTAAPVPEPASMLLLGTGLAGVLARRRMRRS